MKSVAKVWDEAEQRLAEGDAAFLADLGKALAKQYGSAVPQMWQYRSVFDRVLRLLTTTPGVGHIEHAVRLVASATSVAPKQARYAASLLASGQDPDQLGTVFVGGSARVSGVEELRACLLQELILRGLQVSALPDIARWAGSSHWNHHPLRWLPLSLSEVEARPPLPSYTLGGSSYELPSSEMDSPTKPSHQDAKVPAVVETTSDPGMSALPSAVANWAAESNGRFEARIFDLAGDLGAPAVASLLRVLDLECLTGLGARNGFTVSAVRPERAWRTLFAAASAGGAYNHGEYGAYGRLATWRSLGAASGSAEGASFDTVENDVKNTDWYGFSADSVWFEHVAWDIGLVAVSSRRRLAVLAATDTD
ncbi:DUF6183 family protein [Streptomyces sp. NPDC012935]|uniref:DUF6183 family protein n=1 Tax=Streptomyces sp. NPDC012935 TaxID=3364857 RepID=UPI00369E56AE